MTFNDIIDSITNPIQMVENGQVYFLLIPIYVLLIGGERLWYIISQPKVWDDKDSFANVAITIGVLIIQTIAGVLLPLAVFIFLYQFRLFTIPMVWWGWIIVFLFYDITWYIDHYIGHRTGLFWAFHSVHHSSKEYNTTVASRGFIFDTLLITRPLFYLLPFLGVSPIQFIVVQLFTNIWGIAQHTRVVKKMGVLDQILATPSNHRVHHGSNTKYLDKNYGEVLIIWDRIFGTYTKEEEEPTYGLTKNIETYNPIRIEVAGIQWLNQQVKSANRWQDKLAYLYKPPGWRHDGLGETTADLRKGFVQE